MPASQWFGRLLLFACVFAGVARAQLGLDPIDPRKLAEIPEWTPEPQGVGETPEVDLRDDLPAVGNQSPQNSCTAWAVAYACRSHIEARDTGRRASAADRIYSPAFVYNQINGGRDRGSQITDALKLMQQTGCATWATMPYDPRDFTRAPGAEAIREAARHRCRGAYQLKSGAAIRKALQQRNVVILAIRTDPVFLSGSYRVFGAQERARGNAAAAGAPNMAHGYHAIVVVGYDDTSRSFLLMNSWGPRWGDRGFCRVSYDVMNEVAPTNDHFVQAAFVLVGPLREAPPVPRPDPMPNRAVAASGNTWYSGVRDNRPVFGFRLQLAGSTDAFRDVSQVTWRLPDQGRERSYVVNRPDNGFEITGSIAGTGNMTARGDVRFRDGSTRTVEHTLVFAAPAPAQRTITLVQEDRYWGRTDNRPHWQWTLRLRGNLTDLADVRSVTYHLHPTFPDPNRVVNSSPETGFAFTTVGWGTFPIKATVTYRDGSTQALGLDLKFSDPVRDALTLTNTARPVGRGTDGQMYFDWTAYVDGPVGVLARVKGVRYHLHPTFPQPVRDVTAGAEFGFPLSTRGWGVFDLKAEVFFTDGSTQVLAHRLSFARD